MARFCTECGKEIPEGAVFCVECGARAPVDIPPEIPANIPQEEPAAQPVQQPYAPPVHQPRQPQSFVPPAQQYSQPGPYTPPAQPEANAAAPKGRYGVVGTGYFFGMMFLYSIPVLGALICIITAFAPKNESKKNFARACLIWILISLVLSILVCLGLWIAQDVIMEYINDFAGTSYESWADLFKNLEP